MSRLDAVRGLVKRAYRFDWVWSAILRSQSEDKEQINLSYEVDDDRTSQSHPIIMGQDLPVSA